MTVCVQYPDGRWWRVLREFRADDGTAERLEVALTPAGDYWEREVRPVVLREVFHRPHVADLVTVFLPLAVWRTMARHLGGELRHELVTTPYLKQLDWAAFRAHPDRATGVPLDTVRVVQAPPRPRHNGKVTFAEGAST